MLTHWFYFIYCRFKID